MKIALTQRTLYYKNKAYDSVEQSWYSLLKNHTLYLVPNDLTQNFNELAESVDGLIITGGDDSALRSAVEMKLSSEMLKLHKPILGVCHGAFLLTNVLGGLLDRCDHHMDTEHQITYLGISKIVNSYHTNVIKRPHSTATILAYDLDNNCEAWVDGNMSGIVWHPERMSAPWIPSEISNQFLIAN